jgi:hypothetical protein
MTFPAQPAAFEGQFPTSGELLGKPAAGKCFNCPLPMTKAELISAIAALPDEGEVLVEPWPGQSRSAPVRGELFSIEVQIIEGEGWHSPAFAHIAPILEPGRDPAG